MDTDRRAARFFVDQQKVEAELAGRTGAGAGAEVTFLNADYTTALPLPTAGFDLLISLYAGLVLDHCRQYLTPGGLLLANTSHGDASLAAFDPRDEYGLDREAAGSDARMMARRLAAEEGQLAGTSSLGSSTPAAALSHEPQLPHDTPLKDGEPVHGLRPGPQVPLGGRELGERWERFTPFLAFGPAVRRVIYTTNSIESLNYQLRKIIKDRGHFPNDAAAVKLLWLAIMSIEDKRTRERANEHGTPKSQPRKASGRLVEGAVTQGWKAALGELSLVYSDRINNYL